MLNSYLYSVRDVELLFIFGCVELLFIFLIVQVMKNYLSGTGRGARGRTDAVNLYRKPVYHICSVHSTGTDTCIGNLFLFCACFIEFLILNNIIFIKHQYNFNIINVLTPYNTNST